MKTKIVIESEEEKLAEQFLPIVLETWPEWQGTAVKPPSDCCPHCGGNRYAPGGTGCGRAHYGTYG